MKLSSSFIALALAISTTVVVEAAPIQVPGSNDPSLYSFGTTPSTEESPFVAADFKTDDHKGTANVNLCKTPFGLFPCKSSELKPKTVATKATPKKEPSKHYETAPKAQLKPKEQPKPKQQVKPKPHPKQSVKPKQEAKPIYKEEAKPHQAASKATLLSNVTAGGNATGGNGGNASGGSSICSTGNSLIGISALNLNSCNGGNGGYASGGSALGGNTANTLISRGRGDFSGLRDESDSLPYAVLEFAKPYRHRDLPSNEQSMNSRIFSLLGRDADEDYANKVDDQDHVDKAGDQDHVNKDRDHIDKDQDYAESMPEDKQNEMTSEKRSNILSIDDILADVLKREDTTSPLLRRGTYEGQMKKLGDSFRRASALRQRQVETNDFSLLGRDIDEKDDGRFPVQEPDAAIPQPKRSVPKPSPGHGIKPSSTPSNKMDTHGKDQSIHYVKESSSSNRVKNSN